MAVTPGGLIEDNDFNDAKDRVLAVLGNGSGQSGYGQIVSSAEDYAISSNDELISHNEWNSLIADINKGYQHQSGASGLNISFATGDVIGANASGSDVRTYFKISSIDVLYPGENIASLDITVSAPEKTGGTTALLNANIDGNGRVISVSVNTTGSGYLTIPTLTLTGDYDALPELRVNLELDESVILNNNAFKGISDVLSGVTTIESNAETIAGGQFDVTTGRQFNASTRFSPWGGDGDPDDVIFSELDVRFKGGYAVTGTNGSRTTASHTDHRRHFFNSGGEIHLSFASSDFTTKDANWNSMFTSIGTVKFQKNKTIVTGDGAARDGNTNVDIDPPGGSIITVEIVDGGARLDLNNLSVVGGQLGSGATFTFSGSGGVLTGMTVVNGGDNYFVDDQLFIDSPGDTVNAVARVSSINPTAGPGTIESPLGNFQLSTSYQIIFRKYGSNAYSQNYVEIQAKRVLGVDPDTLEDYDAVRFKVFFFDDAEGNPDFDERVLATGGSQTAGIDLKRANDSDAVSIPEPEPVVPTEFQET